MKNELICPSCDGKKWVETPWPPAPQHVGVPTMVCPNCSSLPYSPACYTMITRISYLKVSYELSDPNGVRPVKTGEMTFQHEIHCEKHDFTEEQAFWAVTEMASQWVKFERIKGNKVKCTDSSGAEY